MRKRRIPPYNLAKDHLLRLTAEELPLERDRVLPPGRGAYPQPPVIVKRQQMRALTEYEIANIQTYHAHGIAEEVLADIFGCTVGRIRRIVLGEEVAE